MTFVKGQSGNPAGPPIGSRDRKTLAVEALIEEEGEGFIKEMLRQARRGNPMAMRLLMERLVPVRRERPVPLLLPRIETYADAVAAAAEITEAVGAGAITPREAGDLLRMLEGVTRALRTGEAGTRLVNNNENTTANNNAPAAGWTGQA